MIAVLWFLLVYIGVPIGLVIFLVNRSNKNKNSNSVTVSQPTSDSPTAITSSPSNVPKLKPKNPYAGIEIMLLVGSIFLVAAIISFTNQANSNLVAPVAIALTLIFYSLGFFIRKKNNYLKIVGQAFLYISLAIFPIWEVSFNFFGMSWHGAWILASIISFIMFTVTALAFNDKIIASFSYIWLYVMTWSFVPDIDPSSDFNIALYWIATTSALLSLIPASLWKTKPSWLPVCFRKPTSILAQTAEPFVACCTTVLYMMPDTLTFIPFLRSLTLACLLIWALICWSNNKRYGWFVFSRFVAQFLLFVIVIDALNYSFITGQFMSIPDSTRLAMIVTWLIGSLAQILIALFSPKKDESIAKIEQKVEYASLISIFVALFFSLGMSEPMGSITRFIICVIIAILGVIYTMIRKDVRWILATMLSLLILPYIVAGGFGSAFWTDWLSVAYFAVMAAIVLGLYKWLCSFNEKDGFVATAAGLVGFTGLCVLSSMNVDYAEIGWLVAATMLAAFGYLSKHIFMYELSIYAGALCLFSLVGTIGDAFLPKEVMKCVGATPFSVSNTCSSSRMTASYTNWIAALNVIRSYILGGALLAVSALKERDLPENKRWRFILSYILTSLGLFAVGATAGGNWMLFCIATQVFYLIYGALKDLDWLVWATIIVTPISALTLTGGFTYIWFGILGLVLIGVVVWRLTKMHKAQERAEAKAKIDAPTQPNQIEQSSEEK